MSVIETQGKEIIEPNLLYNEDEQSFELGIQAIMDFQDGSSKNVFNIIFFNLRSSKISHLHSIRNPQKMGLFL